MNQGMPIKPGDQQRNELKRRVKSQTLDDRGATRPVSRPRTTPLARRNPLLTWRLIAGVSIAINLVCLMVLMR